MGNLGGAEILVILLVALIVLGPTKLPPAVRQVGKVVGEIRRIGQGFQQELREAAQPLKETTNTLKAADKELRQAARKPIQEMKDTLKAADPRKLAEPAAAASIAGTAADKGSAESTDPFAGVDSGERKASVAGVAADAAASTTDEGAGSPADESGSGSAMAPDESGSGPDTASDESGSGSDMAPDESGSGADTAA